MSGEEGTSSAIVKLLPVVSLDVLNRAPKLVANIGVKGCEGGEHIGLVAQGKRPGVMRVIIQYNKVVLIARVA